MGYKSRVKKDPNRHKAILKARSLPSGGQEVITMRSGYEQVVNPIKKFLMGKTYSHEELKKNVLRKVGQMALGPEKYAALEAEAANLNQAKAEKIENQVGAEVSVTTK